MSENYSYETSLPAYQPGSRDKQEQIVLRAVIALKDKACIKTVSTLTGITDGIVSARFADLRSKGKLEYFGKSKIEGMLRKQIRVVKVLDVEEKSLQIKMF
jgi:hypothetical protein